MLGEVSSLISIRVAGSTRESTSAYVWHIPEQRLDLLKRGYADNPLYPNRIAIKFLRNMQGPVARQNSSDCISSMINSLAAVWEFCCFLFWASTFISHLVFIGLQRRQMTGVYTGTDFRRGFECWAGHLFIFFIYLFFLPIKRLLFPFL